MIKSPAFILKILVLALVINTTAFIFFESEFGKNSLNSVVHFAVTISPPPDDPPTFTPPPEPNPQPLIPTGPPAPPPLPPLRPRNLLPPTGSAVFLPLFFVIEKNPQTLGEQYYRTQWLFRRSDRTYDPPALMIDSANGVLTSTFIASSELPPSYTYFWKARVMNPQYVWSEFSDETSVSISQFLPIQNKLPEPLFPTPVVPTVKPPVKVPEKPPVQKKPAVRKPSSKPSVPPKPAPLQIRLKNKIVPKGKTVELKIQKTTAPKTTPQKTVVPPKKIISPQPTNLKIQIRNKQNQLRVESTEMISDEPILLEKSLKETVSLEPGPFLMVASFEADGTNYVYEENFEITPADFKADVTMIGWNEVLFTFLLVVIGLGFLVIKRLRF